MAEFNLGVRSMKKSRKICALICALTMIASLFSAFTVANAANEVALLVDVVEDTTMDKADGGVTYQFRLKGVTEINAFQLVIPVDAEVFSCSDKDISADALAKSGILLKNYDSGKATVSWMNASGSAVINENMVLAEVTLTNASEALKSKRTITMETVNVGDIDGTKYTIANGNIDIPVLKVGLLPQRINNTVVVNKVSSGSNVIRAGDTVDVAFTFKGMEDLNAVGLVIDVDTSMFSCSNADIKADALSKAGGVLTTNFNANKGKLAINWANAAGATIADGTVIAEVTLTAVSDISEIQTLAFASVTIGISDGTKYTADDLEVADIIIDPTTKAFKVNISDDIQNGKVTADKAEAEIGDTVTLTVTPDAGWELKTLSVIDTNGTPVVVENKQFVMPASNVTVTAEFEQPHYGDVDGSEGVDIFDALEIMKHASFMDSAIGSSEAAKKLADVDGSGVVDIFDALEIMKYASFMDTDCDDRFAWAD